MLLINEKNEFTASWEITRISPYRIKIYGRHRENKHRKKRASSLHIGLKQ